MTTSTKPLVRLFDQHLGTRFRYQDSKDVYVLLYRAEAGLVGSDPQPGPTWRQSLCSAAESRAEFEKLMVEIVDEREELLKALKLTQRMVREALPKFNWGASALDANAIALLNEAPRAVDVAIAKAEGK